METIEILQLDENDMEIADILTRYGLTENEGKVLVCVKSLVNVTSDHITRCINMNQSRISIAVNGLMDKGYVKSEKEIKKEDSGKGRPSLIYSLNKPVDDIIDEIEKQTTKQIEDIKESIQRLKELV